MKRRSFFLCLLAASALVAQAIPVESTITAVTVYPDRALVTHSGAIELPVGESVVTLSGLPANLWDDSLQVRGSGPTGTTILDVNSRNVHLEAEPSPDIARLEETDRKSVV